MKHLLLIILFSGSLDSFSQAVDSTQPFLHFDATRWPIKLPDSSVKILTMADFYPKPDTLRAICLVTLFPHGIAHARMGFVVIAEGNEVKYLDCRKNALKLPQVGWGYRVVNPNERVR